MHQVNLEYLARIVSLQNEDILFPDTCAGTDSHITMVNGLGVLGWTVGTLEAEAVMFGHPLTFQIPKVIGVKLLGKTVRLVKSRTLSCIKTSDFSSNECTRDFFC